MDKAKTISFLKALGATVPNHQPRTGWVISDCPLGPWRHDGGKSSPAVFGIKTDPGDARCNCFSCGWSSSISTLKHEVQRLNKKAPNLEGVDWKALDVMIEAAQEEFGLVLDSPDIEEVLFGAKKGSHVFPNWWLDSFPKWSEVKFARQYLDERNVPAKVADDLGLRADSHEMRVCFPVHDFKGQLVGLHGRAIKDGVNPRYRMYLQAGVNNPIHWLGESWVDFDKPLLAVEGPFDLASVMRVYRNVASPLFANPSFEKLHRMAPALEWITLFDRGKGGDSGREKVTAALKKDHVVHHLMPPEGVKDPGAMTEDQIREVLLQVLPASLLETKAS